MQTVTVTNTVDGYAGNAVPFTYTAIVTDWSDSEDKPAGYDDYDDYGFTDGKMTFDLTNGQSKELRVPYGAKLSVAEGFIVGYETTVALNDEGPIIKLGTEFDVRENATVAFANSQLINLVLVNNTSSRLENVQVKIDDATVMYRVNDNKDGQNEVNQETTPDSFDPSTHWATVTIDAGKTAILEVNHTAPVGKRIQEYEDPYTVKGTTPADGYYYTITNEPSFHEFADPAIQRIYNTGAYQVNGRLRYSIADSTVTFTEQPLVSFDSNGGAWTTEMEGYYDRYRDRQVYQKAVTTGEKVTRPNPDPFYPTSEGIAFLGWTTDDAFAKLGHTAEEDISAKEYNFDTPVTTPITLYAVWAKPARDESVVTVKNGHNESLNVTVRLTKNNAAIAEYALADGLTTVTNGEARFTLPTGESKNLTVPDGAKLVLSLEKDSLAVSSEYALTTSDNRSFTIQAVKRDGTVSFTPGICKITDAEGNTLYSRKEENGETVYSPAVFEKLSDAFANYVGSLYVNTGETTWKSATPACVKMLVDEYTTLETTAIAFPNATMTLTTAGKGDAEFPYVGVRDCATIYRSKEGATAKFFTLTSGNITLNDIILDGGSEHGVSIATTVAGGLINMTGGTLAVSSGTTLRNVKFAKYDSTATGGAINMTGGTLTVNAGLFSNLRAYRGGAIYTSGGTLNIKGSSGSTRFENCSTGAGSEGDGGAIYYCNSSDTDLTINGGTDRGNPGIVFQACVAGGAKGSGGAIYAATSTATTVNAPLDLINKSGYTQWVGPIVMVSGCSFMECSARTTETGNAGNGGGAICGNGVNGLTVSHCTFLSCDTMSRGGAIVANIKNGESVSVSDSTFDNCNCKGQGGGVAVYQPYQENSSPASTSNGNGDGSKTKLSVATCSFDNCSSGTDNGSGGAIQCYVPCMEFTNSTFTDCWAGKEGGAVNNYFSNGYTRMWDGSYMTLTGCTFTGCRAEDRYEVTSVVHYGGAVNTKVKTVNVSDSTFEDCVSTLQDGGALHLGGCGTGTTATIADSTFTNCSAKKHGGAVFSSAEKLEISDSYFYGCVSTQDNGGAVYHGFNCREEKNIKNETSITDCIFSADTSGNRCSAAQNGGAIWSSAKATTIENCTINGSTASKGGAVYFSNTDYQTKLENIDGIRNVQTKLTAVTINNPSGTITGGSITNCTAVNGSAVYVDNKATFSGVMIGGHETETSKPGNICSDSDSGAIHGGTLYFEGNTVVEGNKYSEDLTARDVLMQVDGVTTINTTASGLGLDANIGVYVPDKDQNGNDGQFTSHGLEDTPFGTWGKVDDLLGSFFNDRDENLFGYQRSNTDKKIYWGPYLCKITDSEGNTLKRANGADAVYTRLSTALDEFTSVKNENGQTNAVYIKMLVEDYAIQQAPAISNFPNANVTLTTASKDDTSHPYRGTEGTVCTIYRDDNSNNQLFSLNNAKATFQLKDITLDGRKDKTGTTGNYRLIEADKGALYINPGTTLQYGSAANGGAIYATEASVTVNIDTNTTESSVSFFKCTATANGGAICANSLTIQNSESGEKGTLFKECTAAKGGAVCVSGSTMSITGAKFEDCHSTDDGGAVCHDNDSAVFTNENAPKIKTSTFTSCYAETSGGAVSSKAGRLTVEQSSFDDCYAVQNGGAINHVGTSETKITGTDFTNCETTSTDTASGFGGSVYTGAGTVTLTSGRFTNSIATNNGGALYCANSTDDSAATISGTSFENCSTTFTDGAGGAIYSNNKALTLQDYTPEGSTVTTATVINNCKAPQYSGAVHMVTDGSTLTITGSTSISHCYANKGGAIYLNSTVIMDLSGSAVFTKNGFTTTGQTVTDGACIYLAEGSLLNISGKLSFSDNCPDPNRRVTNGGETNPARQDIYIAGYPEENATSLHISGELTGDTIWIWAQYSKHRQPVTNFNQFATTEVGVSAASLEKLRNAHDKSDTACLNSDYLTGVRLATDDTGTLVYWNRAYGISFMKKDNKIYPVVGAEFTLYNDAAFTQRVASAKSADGENDKDAKGAVLEEGTVYFAAVPIGIYYMKESGHKSYKPNNTVYLVLVGTPTLVLEQYDELWTSGPLNVPNAKTIVAENTPKYYGIYELGEDGKAILDTNLALTGKYIVNERLDYSVSFMKLDGEGVALPGASFTIYEARETVADTDEAGNPVLDEEGNPVLRPKLNENGFPDLKLWKRSDESVTATSADGTNNYRDKNNKTLKKGVVYFREIPKGTWYLRETDYPSRNGSNRISYYVESDRVFRLEVKGDESIEIYEWDSSNKDKYTDILLDKSGDYYQMRNIDAVCKLTNGDTLLYELSHDGETLYPAVYSTLEEGFAAAQNGSFYDENGNLFTAFNALKLQVLKDFTIKNPIIYSNVDRPLTLTTAARKESNTDRYVFSTIRTTDTSRAEISRAYSESDADIANNSGALITVSDGANLTLQNINLDGQNLNGRALHVLKGSLTVSNNTMIQNFNIELHENSTNEEKIMGGAILLDDHTTLFVDGGAANRSAVFRNNKLVNLRTDGETGSGADGGAIAVGVECTVSLTNAQFLNNTVKASSTGQGNGGAVYMHMTLDENQQKKLPLKNTVFNNNSASNNGGALYTAELSYLTVDNSSFSGNIANEGSAIFVDDNADVTVTDGTITGNMASGKNGGAINIAGEQAKIRFTGRPFVFDNRSITDPDNESTYKEEYQRNVVLDKNSFNVINTTGSGLAGNALIGVYVTGDLHQYQIENLSENLSEIPFWNHGRPSMPLGTFGDTDKLNPQVFRNDRNLALYGVSKSNDQIYWNDVVCKLTDANDNLLYQNITFTVNGSTISRKSPAVYTSIQDGFDAAQGELFTKNGVIYTPFSGESLKLKMLKDVELTDKILYEGKRSVTFTTAEKAISGDMVAADDFFVFETDHETALITRASVFNRASMIIVEGKNLTLTNIILDGSSVNVKTDGGIAYVQKGGSLTVTNGAVLQNSVVSGNGGAVFVAQDGTVTVNSGTIDSNSAAYGAGIYLTAGSTLYLSGDPSFGGTDCVTQDELGSGKAVDDLKGTDGNFVRMDFKKGEELTNGGKQYRKDGDSYLVRQDIFLAGTADFLGSINVTDSITSGNGTIWVWADNDKHYEMLKQFAVFSGNGTNLSDNVKASTMRAFRNARPDSDTICGGEYLTGQKGEEQNWIYWTGGFDIQFKKIDGFGNALSGAVFTLYEAAYDSTTNTIVMGSATDRTATSSDGNIPDPNNPGVMLPVGTVLFEKVPTGVYYMRETATPSVDYVNNNTYIVLVGESTLEGAHTRTGIWASDGTLSGITESNVEAQIKNVNGETTDRIYAIFLIDNTTGEAVATPDIANFGIMNLSVAERKVILRKVAQNTYTTITGAKFRIFRADLSEVEPVGNAYYEVGAAGCYFVGNLPFGKYYLVEIDVTEAGYSGNKGKVFTLEVTSSTTNQIETEQKITIPNAQDNIDHVAANLRALLITG